MSQFYEPEITLLYCGRGLAEGEYLPEGTKKGNGFKSRFVMLACSCKVEPGYFIKLIEEGADGVMLVVCPKDECQFMVGSVRAENRVKYARSLLDEAGIESDRLGVVEGQNLSATEFMTFAEEMAKMVKPLGPNPMKSVKQAV
ncbi:MAG: hydrogenase iron-sulfur subunit [Chloroflexi bacterium]|jgi:coenzyme F420-reducing hydrogenase delta subunit|nr:hydrogenase iron-sulfur subunit [Chloroflexota bacterium]